jgi:hypothetical protein
VPAPDRFVRWGIGQRSWIHFSFFANTSIHEITYGLLEDSSLWLADRDLSAKTRKNVLASFRGFLRWLVKRGQIQKLPEFPTIRIDEHEPQIIGVRDQDRVLLAIPAKDRGILFAGLFAATRRQVNRGMTR